MSDVAPAITLANPNEDVEWRENDVVVVELETFPGAADEEKILSITKWVKAKKFKTRDQNGESPSEASCIIVLGPSAIAYAQMRQLADAGAIFLVQPPGYAAVVDRKEKQHYLTKWLGDLEPALSPETFSPATPEHTHTDLSIYSNSNYAVFS